MLEPLYTLKKSKIWYYNNNVGKKMGSKIYAHVKYGADIVPKDIWDKACEMWNNVFDGIYTVNTFCYDTKKPNVVRFDTCSGFDAMECPVVGHLFYVDTSTGLISFGFTPQIYHHKWMWVKPDYDGFDVQASYEFSKLWLSKFEEPASGSLEKWKQQLEKYNII